MLLIVIQKLTCSGPSTTLEKRRAVLVVAVLMEDREDNEPVLFVSLHQVPFLVLAAFIC